MENIKILVVDDNRINKDNLVKNLITQGFKEENVKGVETGEEAVELVKINPGFFDVAVIDHKLAKGGIDGINTTEEICRYSFKIFPIIFTNIPADNPAALENYKSFAYKAGAYRYMYRSGMNDAGKVKDFISEITQLSELKERVSQFYEARQNVPSLLTQLDIMITLVDRGFKVWYMNAANKRFQKMNDLPRGSCAMAFLGEQNVGPCRGCTVQKTFCDGKSHERIYLHPFRELGNSLKWIYSWTQPMPDENGDPILLEDGKPIAVLESAQDLTDSVRLITMPLEERMEYIAQGLHEREDGFDRVRIYKADSKGENLSLVGCEGYNEKDARNPINISIVNYKVIVKSINYFKKHYIGQLHEKEDYADPIHTSEKMGKFIHWPLMRGERLVGLISVNGALGGRPCSEDKVDLLRDYAAEALKAFETVSKVEGDPEVEKMMSTLDHMLSQKKTPEDTLQTLVDEVYRLTQSDDLHIRFRDKSLNIARLIPIGKGDYYEAAPNEVPLSEHDLPSIRVILRGKSECDNNAMNDPGIKKFIHTLDKESAMALMKIGSYCIEPLFFQNKCVGSLTLFKYEIGHYDSPKKDIARQVAERMALAVRDYQFNIDRMRKDYALESSINAIVFADMEGKIHYVNQSFLSIWGYSNKDEILGKYVADFFNNEDDLEIVSEKLKKGENYIGEFKAKKQDGTYFDVQLSASLVRDKIGKTIGTMASFVDITKQKRLEKVRESIYRISENASTSENLEDLYKTIHEIIKELIPAQNFYIALYDDKTELVSFPYFVDDKEETPKSRRKRKGMTEYVINTGKPILALKKDIIDLESQKEVEIIGPLPYYWIGVPLKTKERTIGVLAVQIYDEGQIFNEDNKNILEFVSTQIAMAIERKRDEKRKEVMLNEINHRVKNNFSFISSLLDLQSRRILESDIKYQFQTAQDRLHLMAMVHDRLYRSQDLSEINFQKYVNDLVNHLFRSYETQKNRISMEINIENISMGIDKAIPCGLIINELVTNSFKYAFSSDLQQKESRGNIICITFTSKGETNVTLIVADNGKGLPREINFNTSDSLGIKLVRLQVQQINGTFRVERSRGTKITITFPI